MSTLTTFVLTSFRGKYRKQENERRNKENDQINTKKKVGQTCGRSDGQTKGWKCRMNVVVGQMSLSDKRHILSIVRKNVAVVCCTNIVTNFRQWHKARGIFPSSAVLKPAQAGLVYNCHTFIETPILHLDLTHTKKPHLDCKMFTF